MKQAPASTKMFPSLCQDFSRYLLNKGWKYLKGSKSEKRKGTDGFVYEYKEGAITFPDDLNRPSRTIITGEGGISPSRFKHVIIFKPTKNQINRLNLNYVENQRIRKELGIGKS